MVKHLWIKCRKVKKKIDYPHFMGYLIGMNKVLREIDILRETLKDSILTPAERQDILDEINRLQVSLLGEFVIRG
tara:strand:- start:202 stop:426 length:225 start_codon:yes stop_codon:yes gene_type:complete